MNIPFNDLLRGFKLFKAEYEAKAIEVLNSGRYIMGTEVTTFEEVFAKKNCVNFCVGVDNGLNAIALGLNSLGIGIGDEVIVQSNSYIATVLAIRHNKATPIFVEPDSCFNMDYKKIEEKITSKTKAILVTHLYGQATRMDEILEIANKYKLYLLEDCAQAHFAEYKSQAVGTFGQLGFFSFYPTKNMGAFGDGGAIITNNIELNEKLRVLRNYGSGRKYYNEMVGYNSRLDELQAGLLNVKLKHVKGLIGRRREVAKRYLEGIQNNKIVLPNIQKEATHTWHLFVIRTKNRNEFRDYLAKNSIGSDVHYPIPPHLSQAYKDSGYLKGDYPIAEEYAETVVSLPLFDGMRDEEVEKVINTINKW